MGVLSAFVDLYNYWSVPIQISFLLCLLTLTVFRKELSTNDEYRAAEVVNEDEHERGSVSETNSSGEHSELPSSGGEVGAEMTENSGSEASEAEDVPLSRIQTMLGTNISRESITRSFGQVPELSEKGSLFLASLLQSKAHTFDFKSLYRLSRRRDRNRNDNLFSKKVGSISSPTPKTPNSSLDSLSAVVLCDVVQYLTLDGISALGNCNRTLAKDTRSDVIWRSLWIQNFGAMWNHPTIASIRACRGIAWNPCPGLACFDEYGNISDINSGSLSPPCHTQAQAQAQAQGSPRGSSSVTPRQGWFMFFLEFDACWVDWLLAGLCTSERCLVGLGGSIYDITRFLPLHPGSQETLTEVCGGDGSEHFVDIGHSSHAVSLANEFVIYSPYETETASSGSGGMRDKERERLAAVGAGSGEESPLSSSSSSSSSSVKEGHSSHLLGKRHKHAINSHRRQMQTFFHQQIRREQRAVERNAFRWNLKRTEREGEEWNSVGVGRGGGTGAARSRARVAGGSVDGYGDDHAGYSNRSATLSEDLQTALGLAEDAYLPGPILHPLPGLGTEASSSAAEAEAEAEAGAYAFHEWNSACGKGLAPHYGRARAIFDPVEQAYSVWWTCCCSYMTHDSSMNNAAIKITK